MCQRASWALGWELRHIRLSRCSSAAAPHPGPSPVPMQLLFYFFKVVTEGRPR